MPDISKSVLLMFLQDIEKAFYEYIADGKSETASEVITRIHKTCDYVKRG